MRFYCWPPAFALVLCLGLGARAAATGELPELPAEVINAPSTLNASQQRTLDSFIHACVDRLTNTEDDDMVADARNHLIDTFGKGGSSVFASAYIAGLSPQLKHALSSSSVPVKVNVLIVASRQIDATTVDLAVMAMKDESPAVRYWAAKVMAQLASAGDAGTPRYTLNAADQNKLLQSASGQLVKEESPQVVAQLIDALANLARMQTPGAIDKAIDALNARVDIDSNMPDEALLVDKKGLNDVYVTLVEQVAKGVKVSDATLAHLALTGYRYMVLALSRLDKGQVHLNQQGQYAMMVELGDTVLNWVSGQLGTPTPAQDFKALLNNRDWSGLLHRADDWMQFLKNKPYNFTDKDLTVTVPDSE